MRAKPRESRPRQNAANPRGPAAPGAALETTS